MAVASAQRPLLEVTIFDDRSFALIDTAAAPTLTFY